MVIRLTPSPSVPGLIELAVDETSTKVKSAMAAQRDNARRTAPNTSLPALTLAPGELNEADKAITIDFFGHLICRGAAASVNSMEDGRTGGAAANSIANAVIMVTKDRRIMKCRGEVKYCRSSWARWLPARWHGSTLWPLFGESMDDC